MRAFAMIMLVATPAAAADPVQEGGAILARAAQAAGGSDWINARTLVLEGRAVFYAETGAEPKSRAEDYRMWRVFDPARTAAHGADGKVRILARSKQQTLFTIGYDGETTWSDRGVMPKAEADAYWAANFGFGIIRHAAKPGFKAERVPDDTIGGHPLHMVRLTDPRGAVTLFGIDAKTHAIRTMGFMTPRGWHQRVYDDFVMLEKPRWLQARRVTLYYNGVMANEVFWDKVEVNVPIDPALFSWRP
ncbi:hypothetical protein [Sphingomonas cavernae]|uniref:Outer membrane lipoprotein-sorting protein n=1 Tax=Sphingomonas cavernae TaxID=2320861 RepID=A0A418WKL2_9SPHN|nr:hypothetical protein [Sphingomonas cavernae]RJF90581.1 hypothetical protein D3876_10165 [Sphingomonas cavernae]